MERNALCVIFCSGYGCSVYARLSRMIPLDCGLMYERCYIFLYPYAYISFCVLYSLTEFRWHVCVKTQYERVVGTGTVGYQVTLVFACRKRQAGNPVWLLCVGVRCYS